MLTEQQAESFWAKVIRTEACWIWTAADSGDGYGIFTINSKNRRAHRLAYELTVGPIPEGMSLDHLCRVRNCINPEHLEPVTVAENNRRAAAYKTACTRGHEYTPENTRYNSAGARACRECDRWRCRRRRAARREATP